jgi:hypothetical protein
VVVGTGVDPVTSRDRVIAEGLAAMTAEAGLAPVVAIRPSDERPASGSP